MGIRSQREPDGWVPGQRRASCCGHQRAVRREQRGIDSEGASGGAKRAKDGWQQLVSQQAVPLEAQRKASFLSSADKRSIPASPLLPVIPASPAARADAEVCVWSLASTGQQGRERLHSALTNLAPLTRKTRERPGRLQA